MKHRKPRTRRKVKRRNRTFKKRRRRKTRTRRRSMRGGGRREHMKKLKEEREVRAAAEAAKEEKDAIQRVVDESKKMRDAETQRHIDADKQIRRDADKQRHAHIMNSGRHVGVRPSLAARLGSYPPPLPLPQTMGNAQYLTPEVLHAINTGQMPSVEHAFDMEDRRKRVNKGIFSHDHPPPTKEQLRRKVRAELDKARVN